MNEPHEVIIKVTDLDRISDKIREQYDLIHKLKIHPLIKEDLLGTVNTIKQILEKAKLREV
jgi:hypothetical protein